jgi:hypothetical protein
MRKWAVFILAFSLCSCSSYLNIGSSEFDCPHVRPNAVKCVPPSVIEQLDEQGRFDWRWHPLPEDVCKKCRDCCRINELLKEAETRKSVVLKGGVFPEQEGSEIDFRGADR